MKARDLPGVLWLLVADFLHRPTLALTCRELGALLARRNVTVNLYPRTAAARCAALEGIAGDVRTLWVVGWELPPPLVPPMAAVVAGAPQLRALRLLLRNSPVGQHLRPLLLGLGQLPWLHTLALDLFNCGVTVAEVQLLQGLHALPSLQVVVCDLRINQLGSEAAMAISALQHSTVVRSVTASLSRIQDLGAHALAGLRRAPNLQVLHLDLVGSSIGPEGAWALAQLGEAPGLQVLTLILSGNEVGDPGAQALAALRHTPQLRRLDLRLASNKVGDAGAASLAQLADAPQLAALNLDLRSNAITNAGAKVLQNATARRQLAEFEVLLEDNLLRNAPPPGPTRVRGVRAPPPYP
eukprot:EG_transcript_14354